MLLRARLACVLLNRYQPTPTTTASSSACQNTPRTFSLESSAPAPGRLRSPAAFAATSVMPSAARLRNRVSRSADRRGVECAALAPLLVYATRDLQRADVARIELAVVAHRLERAHQPVVVETEALADITAGPHDALD